MVCLHGYPATAVADILHGRELVFANVLRINLRCAAETALLGIATGITQVTGLIGHRPAGFTRIGHGISPFSLVVFQQVCVRQNRAHSTGKNEAGNVKSGGDAIAAPGVILADPESPGTCADDVRESDGFEPALCTRRRREIVEMGVPPGNHRGSDLRGTWSVRRKGRDPRTPGRTAIFAVAVGGSCILRASQGEHPC